MNRTAIALALCFLPAIPAASAAEPLGGGGLLGDLAALSPGDLGALTAGGPLVITRRESTGGATADGEVTIGAHGAVDIRSRSQAAATIIDAPVSLAGDARLSTGGFGAVTMENGAGIAGLQMATGFNNIQQNSVSFAFVLSGTPGF